MTYKITLRTQTEYTRMGNIALQHYVVAQEFATESMQEQLELVGAMMSAAHDLQTQVCEKQPRKTTVTIQQWRD